MILKLTKKLERLRRFLIAIVAIAAVLQWVVVLERLLAAVWAWYKFVGYGGRGHIVVSPRTQAVLLFGSGVVAALGYVLFKVESHSTGSNVWRRLAWFGWSSIAVCILFWTALLLSPLVAL
jgi:hypothetical protein